MQSSPIFFRPPSYKDRSLVKTLEFNFIGDFLGYHLLWIPREDMNKGQPTDRQPVYGAVTPSGKPHLFRTKEELHQFCLDKGVMTDGFAPWTPNIEKTGR